MDTLLMLSGGIDSAYCLWKHVDSGRPIRTHHVVLADHEGRQQVESQATAAVLSWVRAHRPGIEIRHSESRVDFGSVRWIPKNYHLWSYWVGTILANPRNKDITKVVLPRHSDAFPAGSRGPALSDRAYTEHVRLIAGREPELVYPMVHMTKAEVIAAIPRGLLKCTWWCRRPQGQNACHACATCKMVDPHLPR